MQKHVIRMHKKIHNINAVDLVSFILLFLNANLIRYPTESSTSTYILAPSGGIGNLIPNQVHQNNIKTEKLWKNYYIKSPTIVNQ